MCTVAATQNPDDGRTSGNVSWRGNDAGPLRLSRVPHVTKSALNQETEQWLARPVSLMCPCVGLRRPSPTLDPTAQRRRQRQQSGGGGGGAGKRRYYQLPVQCVTVQLRQPRESEVNLFASAAPYMKLREQMVGNKTTKLPPTSGDGVNPRYSCHRQ